MLRIFKTLHWKEWLYAALSVGFIVLQVWLDLTMPDYMSRITLAITGGTPDMAEVWKDGGLMLACALGSALSSVAVGFFAARIGAAVSYRLRASVFGRVESFSMQEINRFSTASLITRTTNDIMQVQMIISMGLQVVIKAPILAVWAIAKITSTHWQWSAVTAAAVVLMVGIDTRTEVLIQQAMDRLTVGRTSFIIAHRLSTIKNADLILVMNGGDIVESGTHAQLLERGGFYAELYNSQFEQA